jgi:hypothetical protein
MMAGVAEFFVGLYELPKPVWVDKPEYFLAPGLSCNGADRSSFYGLATAFRGRSSPYES